MPYVTGGSAPGKKTLGDPRYKAITTTTVPA
jgi:hypothetical protein